ncbi:MAG: hypothetical protein GX097_01280 [Methanomicrobiales archaeon]|nr:hypothetical protein [Methanomicrobiales archaeon]
MTYDEIDLTMDAEARDLLIEKTGRIGAPVVRIGDDYIFGFDRNKMEQLLQ